jgi:hypothetical protein
VVRKVPALKRISMDHGDYILHRGFDGERSWRLLELKNGERRIEELSGSEKAEFESDPYHLDLLFFPSDSVLQHSFLGVEYIGRVPCYKIASEMGAYRRVAFLDSRTLRVPRIEEYDLTAEGPVLRATQELKDYVRERGIWIARDVTRTLPDGQSLGVRFVTVAVNEGIFDDVFAMPSAE